MAENSTTPFGEAIRLLRIAREHTDTAYDRATSREARGIHEDMGEIDAFLELHDPQPHEPDNTRGNWCCQSHEAEFNEWRASRGG